MPFFRLIGVLPVSIYACNVTGQYHKAAPLSRFSSKEQVMSISEATAVRAHDTASRPSLGTEELFSPYQLGDLDLDNRMVLSPMTRSRALEGNVPNPIAATSPV